MGVALIVSGEIAGVKAAIDLADAGFAVYLLDESTNIKGIMADLNKILRTNDCPLCVLPPKLVGGTENARTEREARKDLCSRCKVADPFASTTPANEHAKKPNGV